MRTRSGERRPCVQKSDGDPQRDRRVSISTKLRPSMLS
jgi:hypothetical protein